VRKGTKARRICLWRAVERRLRMCMAGLWVLSLSGAVWAQGVRFTQRFNLEDLKLRETYYPPKQTKVTSVHMRGMSHSAEPGFPLLPFMTCRVAVPKGAQIFRPITKSAAVRRFEGHPLVEWQQAYQPGGKRRRVRPPPEMFVDENGEQLFYPADDHFIAPDPSLAQYRSWPPESVRIRDRFTVGGFDVLTVDIFPVKWFPREAVLEFTGSMFVEIRFEGGTTPHIKRPTYRQIVENQELRASVVNADSIAALPPLPFYEQHEAWYLIITDNRRWNENMTPGAELEGDMIAQFERLAQWKREKGLKARVVTITDIVNHRYGVFDPPGTRDLQEVLRNFLKHAYNRWQTYWLLLGGDVSVIPPRPVVGNARNASHYIFSVEESQPGEACCYYDATHNLVRIHQKGNIGLNSEIVSVKTGRVFKRVSNPSTTKPGWEFVRDDTYSASTWYATSYIRLFGPAADIQGTDFYVVLDCNTIPTDLYYASLVSPYYDRPGLHDWDWNDNGIYGQYSGTTPIDGVSYWPNLAVGRAPVESGEEAAAFVDKVLAYEKYQGLRASFVRKLLLGASNWSGLSVKEGAADPPVVNRYFYSAGTSRSKCHFKSAVSPAEYDLVGYNAPGNCWYIPYDRNASSGNLGYYFCTSDSYAVRSEIYINLIFYEIEIPIPTRYVLVRGPAARINPARFFFDSMEPDSAVVEKEQVKDILSTVAPGLSVRKRYYSDWEDTPDYPAPDLFELSTAAMAAELEAGYNVVSLSGHGNPSGCAGVSRDYVGELTNGVLGGIVYAESCSTCRFDDDDAVGEIFVRNPTGGAVGYVGNARFSWVGSGDDLEREFWKKLSFFKNLGKLHNAKAFLADTSAHVWAQFALNLMGDPELAIWTAPPSFLVVDHPRCLLPPDTLTVLVKDRAGTPVVNARVCLTGSKGQFALNFTDLNGRALFSTGDFEKGEQGTVTVVAENFVPHQSKVIFSLCTAGVFVRGDANNDSALDIADAVTILAYLFSDGEEPSCEDAFDVNDDGMLDIADPITLLGYLFANGPLPPGTKPGELQEDPTPDNLTCNFYGGGVP